MSLIPIKPKVAMEQKQIGRRTCPACGSEKYMFRGRKKIPPEDGKPEAMETTYRCKECEHAWKVGFPSNRRDTFRGVVPDETSIANFIDASRFSVVGIAP